MASPTEHERLYPGAEAGERNNALDGTGADLPGGSNDDIKGRRGRTAGAQAGHGRKVAEGDLQRGDPEQPSASSDYPTGRPM
ncbi:MAG: hypothetical protein AB7O88_05460 [Reyranellaceae bacterium]